ncbi:hypothetical protein, partial [Klebsiella pneumoniae]|uniref:hypothetical protein n=1 Tax=Klebsiella pneumoniae TaxID=573 RepID=UPI00210E7D9B
ELWALGSELRKLLAADINVVLAIANDSHLMADQRPRQARAGLWRRKKPRDCDADPETISADDDEALVNYILRYINSQYNYNLLDDAQRPRPIIP